MNSQLLLPFISYRSSGEKLTKYQANSPYVIMSVILMTSLFYKALILLGDIWCWSLLGLKEGSSFTGRIIFYPCCYLRFVLHWFSFPRQPNQFNWLTTNSTSHRRFCLIVNTAVYSVCKICIVSYLILSFFLSRDTTFSASQSSQTYRVWKTR